MNHLPECWLSEGKFDSLCLGERLRACKERGLDAAREAIAEIYRYSAYKAMDGEPGWVYQGDPLAAIDALREKP